jgi:ParB family chromosome partitioning protein
LIPAQPVDQIQAGGVFRADLGDVGALADSIRRLGLLCPVVVTPALGLVSGARRLAAVATLGWRTVPAWVARGVSDRLTQVLAARDIDQLRKQLTPVEQAQLYAELEELLAAEAARRKQATQYKPARPADPAAGPEEATAAAGPGPGESPGPAGPGAGADGPGAAGPGDPPAAGAAALFGGAGSRSGEARVEAARRVTGRDSHQRLERINELGAIAADQGEDPLVREAAADALAELDQDGKVDPRWRRVKLAQTLAGLRRTAQDPARPDQERAAASAGVEAAARQTGVADALRQARQAAADLARLQEARQPPRKTAAADPDAAGRRQVRQLVDLLRRDHGWWDRFDPTTFGRLADQNQWALAVSHITSAARFLTQAETARPG